MSDKRQTPNLTSLLQRVLERCKEDIRVSLPAKVLSYDETTQKVTVQPLVKEGYLDESGTRRAEELPAIAEVPVVFPGAGAYSITFPIAKGDTVLLVFSDASLDRWLSIGGTVDSQDDRRHHISDAIAIPGLRPFASPVASAPTDALAIVGDEIRLGEADASKRVLTEDDYDAIRDAINSAAIGSMDGGLSLKTDIVSGLDMHSPGATKVRAP